MIKFGTMRKILFLGLISLFGFSVFAQEKATPIFVSGKDGYQNYRIPALIALPNGDLLAFGEGRVNNAADFGDIDIVMKRSSDGGKTWGKILVVADSEGLQIGNSAPVVDLTDPNYPNGRIFLFFNTGDNHEYEVRTGKGLREVWYKTSADNGLTWDKSVNITEMVHKPNRPDKNPNYNFKEDWRTYANLPGHAIQIQNGKYKGRIYVAANHSAGDPQNDFKDYTAHGYFSDDHGKTFQLSENVNYPGSNESTAVELGNDGLMMNSRNQSGELKARIVSVSKDGGQSWDSTYVDTQLPDPVNQASLLLLGFDNGEAIIAFSNAANELKRDDLTVKISYDSGKSWAKSILIDKSDEGYNGDYTAYSDMVKINENEIGILYEKDNYSKIVFKIIRWMD